MARERDENGAKVERLAGAPGAFADVALRVDYITRRVASGKWGSVDKAVLARKWGVSEATVSGYVAEAGRRLQTSPEELTALRLAYAARAEKIASEAAKRTNMRTGLPEYGHAVNALKLAAQLQGIDPDEPLNAGLAGVALKIIIEGEDEPTPFAEEAPAGDVDG